MTQTSSTSQSQARVARHRAKVTAVGSKRVEVTVPASDANLVKAIASALRSGGVEARQIRHSLQAMMSVPQAKTGPELVAFFRKSPLVGADLHGERDTSTGRSADLG